MRNGLITIVLRVKMFSKLPKSNHNAVARPCYAKSSVTGVSSSMLSDLKLVKTESATQERLIYDSAKRKKTQNLEKHTSKEKAKFRN